MNKYYTALEEHLEKGMALQTAITLLEWDNQTQAPKMAEKNTAKVMGILSDEYFKTYTNHEVKKLLDHCLKEKASYTLEQQAVLKELEKTYKKLEPIPREEYKAYAQLTATAGNVWAKAKEKDNFQEFLPVLNQIISYQKKFASYRAEKGESCYDVLLKDFEESFNIEKLDAFFQQLKEEIVPLLKEVTKKNEEIDKSYNSLYFEVEKQKEFAHWIAGYLGFDFNKGVIAESAHPFTTNLHNHDVRMTDHFYENNLESGIFSIVHETGHALYEMGISDQITQTLVGTGTSMAMHESQSRFFENVIGRCKAFWKPIYPKLQETFQEQLKDISLEQFIKAINKAEPGLIRTEADELTYSLHILIRYEIEKMLFSNEIETKDLPKVWEEKCKMYLGVTPKNDTEGVLQDVHWSGGDFGYFPSYALGNAIAAQIYYHMKSIMPLEEYLEEGNLTPIREFLRDSVHKYGKSKTVQEILKDMMNEEFNPDYYIKYLKEKYTEIYQL